MRKLTGLAALVGAGVAGRAAVRRLWSGTGGPGADRWHVVTVDRPPSEVTIPEPLTRLGDKAHIEVRPGRADRGTELAVKARTGADLGEVRKALREAKQLLETGEVLRPDGPPTTDQKLPGRLIGLATSHAREGGRL
jgi:hypothetical protein